MAASRQEKCYLNEIVFPLHHLSLGQRSRVKEEHVRNLFWTNLGGFTKSPLLGNLLEYHHPHCTAAQL